MLQGFNCGKMHAFGYLFSLEWFGSESVFYKIYLKKLTLCWFVMI